MLVPAMVYIVYSHSARNSFAEVLLILLSVYGTQPFR